MTRTFLMTQTAKQALWCKTSDGKVFIPSYFIVEGTAETFYSVHYTDESRKGFNLIIDGKLIRTMYCVKMIINEINEKGYPDQVKGLVDITAFAWHNIPMPHYWEQINQSQPIYLAYDPAAMIPRKIDTDLTLIKIYCRNNNCAYSEYPVGCYTHNDPAVYISQQP